MVQSVHTDPRSFNRHVDPTDILELSTTSKCFGNSTEFGAIIEALLDTTMRSLMRPHAHIALRLPSASLKVVELVPNRYDRRGRFVAFSTLPDSQGYFLETNGSQYNFSRQIRFFPFKSFAWSTLPPHI
jgi:hypothetical protein